MTTTQTTRINRAWLIKRVLLPVIVLAVIGVWGVVDATIIYPRSGRLDASLKLKNYLQAAQDKGRLLPDLVKVPDPPAELRQLASEEKSGTLDPVQQTKLAWLRALQVVWDINDDAVWVGDVKRPMTSATGEPVYAGVGGVSDAKQERVALFYKPRTAEAFVRTSGTANEPVPFDTAVRFINDYWATAKTPSPLAAYDLPLQWVFAVGGFAGALYILALLVRVKSKRFQFEPETNTLILPGGERVAAADLADVDKRKWHKFYVTLETKDGRAHTLDLYRYDPLEDWVLDMERAAFPDRVRAEEEAAAAQRNEHDALAVPANAGHVADMTYGGMKDGVFALFLFDADAIRRAGHQPGPYAQGEVLKALGVALRDEGGWRQWFTAAAGDLRAASAARALDFITGREPAAKPALSHKEPAYADTLVAGREPSGEWHLVAVGRVSEETARRACDVLLDPPSTGFANFGAVRMNPATIDRIQEPLALDPGWEIKGDTLVGAWEASPEDVETAGLHAAATTPAD